MLSKFALIAALALAGPTVGRGAATAIRDMTATAPAIVITVMTAPAYTADAPMGS